MDVTVAERSQPSSAPRSEEAGVAPTHTGKASPQITVRRRQATLAPPILMEKFIIEGGVPLSGTIVPAGNKNGALPILAACLLTDDPVILRNVPRISDVEAMTLLLESLGARVTWVGEQEVAVNASTVDSHEVDRTLAERIRASFLLAGPLLARFGRAYMPPPGGDVIGRRRLDPHLDAFRALGATVKPGLDIELEAPRGPQPADCLVDAAS